jgi:hypothetical protein
VGLVPPNKGLSTFDSSQKFDSKELPEASFLVQIFHLIFVAQNHIVLNVIGFVIFLVKCVIIEFIGQLQLFYFFHFFYESREVYLFHFASGSPAGLPRFDLLQTIISISVSEIKFILIVSSNYSLGHREKSQAVIKVISPHGSLSVRNAQAID